MSEVFSSYGEGQSQYHQKIENRSLQTHDIQGAYSRKNTLNKGIVIPDGMIAGVRTGSPARKNES